MDITLGKVAGAIPVLQQIKNKKPSFKIDYWVMRNIKLYADSYNFFIQKREEIFEKYYKGQSEMVVDFWMPNAEWEGCNVKDPSARVLANYGDSGK